MSNTEYYKLERDLQRRVENVDADTLRRAVVAFIGESGTDVVRHLAARLKAQLLAE